MVGGAGFIGSNLTDALVQEGSEVIVYDNLARPGVELNLEWLSGNHRSRIHFIRADVGDTDTLGDAVADAKAVFHLAAQVAVTSSFQEPLTDFAVNAQGTLNVLEAVRRRAPKIPIIFASTNKVYGGLNGLQLDSTAGRHLPSDPSLRQSGVDETFPLDFCTPYGCSKGAADQYVLDYAHSFGLRTAVLRMSCIYGPRQFGTEDQGWLAHFLISALRGTPITIYGDGLQVRDVLHVQDAVRAYLDVLAGIGRHSGRAFNLGGGPSNAVSLREVIEEITLITGRSLRCIPGAWRGGDQLYFVANTGALRKAVGWSPAIGWRAGLRDLADWLQGPSFLSAELAPTSTELHA